MAFYRLKCFISNALQPLLLGVLFCICPNPGQCQQVVLNTRGERIVVYPDGSWRYYERGDSTLLAKNLFKKGPVVQEESATFLQEKPASDPSVDADISAMASRFASRVVAEMSQTRRQLKMTLEDKFEAEARLDQAHENRKLIEPDIIASYEDEFGKLITTVKETRKLLKWYEKINARTQDMLAMPVGKKPKALNKLIANYDAYLAGPESTVPQVGKALSKAKQAKPVDTRQRDVPLERAKSTKSKAAPEPDFLYQRAPVPCMLRQPGGTGSLRATIAVEKGLLFTHTDEELRPYFRQQELVTCYAALMQVEDNLYLSLEFQIASSDARKNFGVLEKNSMLRVKLIDGNFVNLFNANTDQGKIDAYTGNTIFAGNYLIDKEAEKALSRYEIDKLRVVWSTGFEDYDVVNLDFLINQFTCLRSALEN